MSWSSSHFQSKTAALITTPDYGMGLGRDLSLSPLKTEGLYAASKASRGWEFPQGDPANEPGSTPSGSPMRYFPSFAHQSIRGDVDGNATLSAIPSPESELLSEPESPHDFDLDDAASEPTARDSHYYSKQPPQRSGILQVSFELPSTVDSQYKQTQTINPTNATTSLRSKDEISSEQAAYASIPDTIKELALAIQTLHHIYHRLTLKLSEEIVKSPRDEGMIRDLEHDMERNKSDQEHIKNELADIVVGKLIKPLQPSYVESKSPQSAPTYSEKTVVSTKSQDRSAPLPKPPRPLASSAMAHPPSFPPYGSITSLSTIPSWSANNLANVSTSTIEPASSTSDAAFLRRMDPTPYPMDPQSYRSQVQTFTNPTNNLGSGKTGLETYSSARLTTDSKRGTSPGIEKMLSRMALNTSPTKKTSNPVNSDRIISKILLGPKAPPGTLDSGATLARRLNFS